MADSNRRSGGRETWHRLLDWDYGQANSERLSAAILRVEGYTEIDPSHPLGGKDGGKDACCKKDDKVFRMAAYFPRGQKEFEEIKTKFLDDCKKVKAQNVDGIAFVTNQELTLGRRDELETIAAPLKCDLFHLERLTGILNVPKCYGLRLEFLSIDMTQEEQVSFINDRDQLIRDLLLELRRQKESPPKVDAEIKTVTVQQHDNAYTYSLYPSKLMKCRKCGEIFRAQKNPLISTVSFGLQDGIRETVTCPHCGKLQEYTDRFF